MITKLVHAHYLEYFASERFPREQHDHWELLYVDRGQTELELEGQTVLVEAGQMVMIPPGCPHIFATQKKKPPAIFSFSFYAEEPCLRLLERRPIALKGFQMEALSYLFSRTAQLCGTEGESGMLWQTDFTAVTELFRKSFASCLSTVLYSCAEEEQDRQPGGGRSGLPGTDKKSRVFQELVGFYRKHIAEFLTLEDVCRHVNLSRSAVSRIFKREAGCGPIAYFYEMKMQQAQEMMRISGTNFSDVAYALGFSNIQYFSRRFKMTTGMSPSAYMNSVRAKIRAYNEAYPEEKHDSTVL